MSLPVRALAGACLSAMTLLSIANGLAPQAPGLLAGLAAWAAGLLLAPLVRGTARLQIGLMLAVGLAAQGAALAGGGSVDWVGMASANQALIAMLAAVSFLRLAASPPRARGPETSPSADPEPKGPAGARALIWTMLGVHLLGSVINLSAVMIWAIGSPPAVP